MFSRHLREVFTQAGDRVDVIKVKGPDLPGKLEDVFSDSQYDGVIAAGGDGTISLAASHAWKSGKLLLPIPAGTMNLFTRGLGIEPDIFTAVEQLADGRDMACDLVTANDYPFIHQFSVGLQPKMIRLRASMPYRTRIGKILASTRATFYAFRSRRNVEARVFCDDEEVGSGEYGLIAVSNNVFGPGHLPYSDHPNEGKLGVYIVPPLPFAGLLSVSFSILTGQWSQHPAVQFKAAKDVRLQFLSVTRRVRASIDGELQLVGEEVSFRVHEKAFTVRVPKEVAPR
ncbi:diacylglycerol kinase family lipid kinase [Rhizobium sp. L1K21]|nr:diacylglycerol kinase family lipid kinase [Rhizobium sp. L1K21]